MQARSFLSSLALVLVAAIPASAIPASAAPRPPLSTAAAIRTLRCSAPLALLLQAGAPSTQSGTASGDLFGYAIAASGDTVVVGAQASGGGTGAAYVFVRTGRGWSRQATLAADDAAPGDYFGQSVAIDRDLIVVGAQRKAGFLGGAYVFERSAGNWTLKDRLTAADLAQGDAFGASVAVSGETIAVGAPGQVFPLPVMGVAERREDVDRDISRSPGAGGPRRLNVNVDRDEPRPGPAERKTRFTGAVYVFARSAQGWLQRARLAAADAAPGDLFGLSVAISGDRLSVGAPRAGNLAGAAYLFARSAHGWAQEARLTAGDHAPGDNFGWSLSLLDVSLVVGAPYRAGGTGAAYVFGSAGGPWRQQAELVARNGAPGDRFGASVSAAEEEVVVGACGTGCSTGAAYAFARAGAGWTLSATLAAVGGAPGDYFGQSVAISGSTIAIGAYGQQNGAGSAYQYVRSARGWVQETALHTSEETNGDQFGQAVATDGELVAIGAPHTAAGIGAAYLFALSGADWRRLAKLTAPDGAPGDEFGQSVSVSGDLAVVGARGKSGSKGAAYVFQRGAEGWGLSGKLVARDGSPGDDFGQSVAVSGDTLVVGAYARASRKGAAYVFERTAGGWRQQAALTAADGAAEDAFGWSVAINADTVAVGAYGKGRRAGAVYVFTRSAAGWRQQAQLLSLNGAAGDALGWSVALDAETLIAGAPFRTGFRGAALVWTRSAAGWKSEAVLSARGGAPQDYFGWSVAVNGDTVVVGAPYCKRLAGAAYAWTRSAAGWTCGAELTAPDASPQGYFGLAVANRPGRLVASVRLERDAPGAVAVFAGSTSGWIAQASLGGGDAVPSLAPMDAARAAPSAQTRNGEQGVIPGAAVSTEAPTAHSRAYATLVDALLAAPRMRGVLAGDSAGSAPHFTAHLYRAARYGGLVLANDGSFRYRPKPGFRGSDGFFFTAVDDRGRQSEPTYAHIEVLDPAVAAITVVPSAVTGGGRARGTLVLTAAVARGCGPLRFRLTGTDPGCLVPPSVVVPEGRSSVNFAIVTRPVAASHAVFVSAVGATAASVGRVEIRAPLLRALKLTSASVQAGRAVTAEVLLTGPVAANTLVLLSTAAAGVRAPESVTVVRRSDRAVFTIATPARGIRSASVTIAASLGAETRSAVLAVN